jgi:micrococcal nuclease
MLQLLSMSFKTAALVLLVADPGAGDRSSVLAKCTGNSGTPGHVRAVDSSLGVVLADGTVVRPALLHWPTRAARGGRPMTDPFAAIGNSVRALLVNEPVVLFPAAATTPADRYGRPVMHVLRRRDGLWLQQEMLRTGLARLQPSPLARFCVSQLAKTETDARENQAGLWARSENQMKRSDDPNLIGYAGSVQTVVGTILSVGRTRRNVYLNFGNDWSLDFTVVLPLKVIQGGKSARFDPAILKGKRVVLRGWIERHDGPQMRVSVPEQIEILEDGRSR